MTTKWPGAWIELPALWDGTNRSGQTLYNKVVKIAGTKTMERHHKTRIPGHFRTAARSKYGYQERKPAYKAIKDIEHHSRTDLVKSGTSRAMISRKYKKIRTGIGANRLMGGGGKQAAGAQFNITMQLRWPFPVSNDNTTPTGVTVQQMSDEVASWTTQEAKDAGADFIGFFIPEYQKALSGGFKRRRKVRP